MRREQIGKTCNSGVIIDAIVEVVHLAFMETHGEVFAEAFLREHHNAILKAVADQLRHRCRNDADDRLGSLRSV